MRRTNNDIFRQLEELTVENEQLKKENKELRAENLWLRTENTRLAQRLETLEKTMEDHINLEMNEQKNKDLRKRGQNLLDALASLFSKQIPAGQ